MALDYCFMRTDTGYDVMMLAIQNKDGIYQVYRLNNETAQGPCLFEEDKPERLRERIQSWCRSHLPDDMAMTGIPIRQREESYYTIKAFLQENRIPFEMKKQTFYISQQAFEQHQDALERLAGPSEQTYGKRMPDA